MNIDLNKRKLLKKSVKPLIILFSALLILSLTAVVFTHQMPLELEVERDIASYKQKATYTCTAELRPNIIYETTVLALKDKVFLKLVKNIDIAFTYNFEPSPLSESSSIVYGLELTVGSPGLWSKSFTIQEPIKLNTTKFTYNMSLDMAWVKALIANITREIGVYSSKFEIIVTMNIYLSASLANRSITRQFTPILKFSLDYGNGIMTISGLTHEDSSTITEIDKREAYLQVFGTMVKVSDARMASQSISIASVAALGFLLFIARPKLGEQDKLKALTKKYSDIIIDVEEPPKTQSSIRVKSLKDLIKIAQGMERPVLHIDGDKADEFYVVSGLDVYFHDVKKSEGQK
ncbi:MAG: DUF5305 family protein [Candidatus Nezhaarchaeales archaeon]